MVGEPIDQTSDAVTPSRTPTALVLREYGKTVLVTLLVALSVKAFVLEAFRIPSGSMENTLQVGDFLLVNKLAYGLRTPRRLPLTSIELPTVALSWRDVRRGDIVVFEYPALAGSTEGEGNDVNYIKRCVGIPGDAVELRKGKVFINGRELLFSRNVKMTDPAGSSLRFGGARPVPGSGFTEDDFGPVVVPRRGEVVRITADNAEEWKLLLHREGSELQVLQDGSVTIDGERVDSYTIKSNYYFMLGDNRHNSLDSRFWGFVPEENLIGEALMVYWSWDPDIALKDPMGKVQSIRWERIGMLVR